MAIFKRLKGAVRAALGSNTSSEQLDAFLQLELSREFSRLRSELRATMPDNPAASGFKVYSQADEDGIIEDIVRRLEIEKGNFVEIGCGNGLENNTHYLLLKGWRGIWVDGDPDNVAAIRSSLPLEGRLRVVELLVTRDNVERIPAAAGAPIEGKLDLLSVDIDGNDLAIADAAVRAWSPKVLVAEYNAKFAYPFVLEVAYNPEHRWAVDDYHGASLAAWVKQLGSAYRLVACNLAGTNAFFVRHDFADRFEEYSPQQLFQPTRFFLTGLRSGHAPSMSFLRASLQREE